MHKCERQREIRCVVQVTRFSGCSNEILLIWLSQAKCWLTISPLGLFPFLLFSGGAKKPAINFLFHFINIYPHDSFQLSYEIIVSSNSYKNKKSELFPYQGFVFGSCICPKFVQFFSSKSYFKTSDRLRNAFRHIIPFFTYRNKNLRCILQPNL